MGQVVLLQVCGLMSSDAVQRTRTTLWSTLPATPCCAGQGAKALDRAKLLLPRREKSETSTPRAPSGNKSLPRAGSIQHWGRAGPMPLWGLLRTGVGG